jgi:hypothetical protein
VLLTTDGVALIDQWAQQHDVSFSAAIETLARVGLGLPTTEAFAPVLISTIRRAVDAGSDRLARMLAYAVVEAGIAQRLTAALLCQLAPEVAETQIAAARTEARLALVQGRLGDQLRALFTVPDDPDGAPAAESAHPSDNGVEAG